ncbi:MAG: TIGR03617 family F420-dependent LLM class oxidoreductase [Ilumatobacteraceae bacterium]|nr:TIGR03617 family F420-dependent LLM class oxidoreductase [Ilumatobacteraceae bacterium]
MKFDVMTGGLPLRSMAAFAQDAERAGFSGIVVTEGGRTAYLGCGAAALATDIDILTGVAVAFPRSPMVTAEIAWELAEATGGRFRLGLGTQVRAHITRRYGSDFEHPGPRLKEYVLAMQAIFRAFRGDEPLMVDGEFYHLDLLPAQWSPGPIGAPNPPIDVAAVNPWMLRMAGEVADGVHVHPLNHPTYLRETVIPNLREGATKAGRSAEDLEIIVPAFIVPIDDDEARWRNFARMQVAFYGSTPNYAFIFEQLGFEGTTDRIRERQRARDLAGMAAEVSDELLDHFVVTGPRSELADKILERYQGLATRVVSYFGGLDWTNDPSALNAWADVARGVTNP